jgi:hypothetical protein
MNTLGPNLWISHDWAGVQPRVDLGGHRSTHLGARPSQSELFFFPQKMIFITNINTPQFDQLSIQWMVSDDAAVDEAGFGGPLAGVVTCGLQL